MRQATNKEMEQIRALIADIEVAMVTTMDPDGLPRSRPMGTFFDRDEGAIWMFLSRDSNTATEIEREPRVALSYADPERDRYVSLAGIARFMSDHGRIRELWRDEFGRWFPGGPDAPSLVLVHVPISQIEYWDDSAKLMRDFFETIGAPYSGIPPDATGKHARVRPS